MSTDTTLSAGLTANVDVAVDTETTVNGDVTEPSADSEGLVDAPAESVAPVAGPIARDLPPFYERFKYAAPTQADAESILNATGRSAFTYNYGKLTKATHSALVNSISKGIVQAHSNGNDYAPTFVSQIKHMPIFIDLHKKGDRLAKEYVSKYCADNLTIIYKIPFRINYRGSISLPGESARISRQQEDEGKFMYIIHPVQSLSEVYLEGSELGMNTSFYTRSLSTEESRLLQKVNKDLRPPKRMHGMSLPFTSTTALYSIWGVISSLYKAGGPSQQMLEAFASITSIHDISFKGTSLLPKAFELMADMLDRKLCQGCPNALLCSIASNESVTGTQQITSTPARYEAQQVQQTCIENYFKHFIAEQNIGLKTRPQKILMAQYVEDDAGTASSSEGYLTHPCTNVLANSLRSATKPEAWITSKINSGAFLGEVFSSGAYGNNVHNREKKIGQIGSFRALGSPKQLALATHLVNGDKAQVATYFPEYYDSRKEIIEAMPRGIEVDKPLREAIIGLISSQVQAVSRWEKSQYEDFTREVWYVVPEANGQTRRQWLAKVVDILMPLLSVEGGKYYLVVNTAFTNETVYQAIAKTTKNLQEYLATSTEDTVVLNLKELKYIGTTACIKLGGALVSAMEFAHTKVYLDGLKSPKSQDSCAYSKTCILADPGGDDRPVCPLSTINGGLTTSDFTEHGWFSSRMPCTQGITLDTDLVGLGPDAIYNNLVTKIPKLDESLRALSVYIDESLSQQPHVGAPYAGGLHTVYATGNRSTKNRAVGEDLLSSVSLYLTEDQAIPLVLDPENPLGSDYVRLALLRLRGYAPEYFHSKFTELLSELKSVQPDEVVDALNVGGTHSKDWLVPLHWDEILQNNTVEVPRYTGVQWGVNLAADPSYESKGQQLTRVQTMYYEMLRARIIAPLAPMVIKNLTVEVGRYPAGLLRIQRGEVSDRKAGVQHVVSMLLHRQAPLESVSSEDRTTACVSMAEVIKGKLHDRTVLFSYLPKDKYLRDSAIVGYSIANHPEGGVQDMHVYRSSVHKLGEAATQRNAYPEISLLKDLSTYTDRALVAPRLHRILDSDLTGEALHKAMRLAVYSYDFNHLLGLYWLYHGVPTSNLGLTSIIVSQNEEIVPGPKDICPVEQGYQQVLRHDAPSEKYIDSRISDLMK